MRAGMDRRAMAALAAAHIAVDSASGARRASGMSVSSVGGNAGYTLGALVTRPFVVGHGVTGGLLLMVPCLVVAGLLMRRVPFLLLVAHSHSRAAQPVAGGGPEKH